MVPKHLIGHIRNFVIPDSYTLCIDLIFQMEMGFGNQKGIMVSTCELSGAAKNILSCDMEEIIKKLKFKAVSVFTKAGFINTR